MSKLARRITLVTMDGTNPPRVIFKNDEKRKKGSAWLAPLEHIEWRLLRAQNAFSDELLRRHQKSNSDNRDGWIQDAPTNVYKAARKAYRVYRKIAPQLLPR